MTDIDIRISGRAGRITLSRPDALNALTYEMCLDIEAALDKWRDDNGVSVVIIDAVGEKAFCAGGDIQKLYDSGRAGDFAYGRKFWADEYRLNLKIAEYPKPIVSLMQGFTMGGGVGIGCHASHRIVCESSQIAMPECSIGLVPDVGGSLLLKNAPGRMGEYLGTTGYRMGPGAAIYAGFADSFVPQAQWDKLSDALEKTADVQLIADAARTPPASDLPTLQHKIDASFSGESLTDILANLEEFDDSFAEDALRKLKERDPLAMACCVTSLHRLRRSDGGMREALALEYRFTFRAMEDGDFLEGIRAAVIDKDRKPKWSHSLEGLSAKKIEAMLAPLGDHELTL